MENPSLQLSTGVVPLLCPLTPGVHDLQRFRSEYLILHNGNEFIEESDMVKEEGFQCSKILS